MCFHNSMSKKAQALAARYGKKSDIIEIVKEIIEEQYHVSAFNCPKFPIVTNDEEIQVYQWGLIPSWIKTQREADEIRQMTFNAKAETVFEKPSFKSSILHKRCLVPSTGFFEWRHDGGKKIPYFIFLKDVEIFSLAGIYSLWTDTATGDKIGTFSVLITEANPMMEYIHNSKKRMPAILSPETEQLWLSESLDKQGIANLLKPYNEKEMSSYIIRNDFLRKSPHDPSIIQPLDAA